VVLQAVALALLLVVVASNAEGTVALVLWTGFAVSAVLTVRGLITRSWVLPWVAALGTLPFLLSSVGIFTVLLTGFQVAAAGALRQNASARGWAAFLVASILIWVAVMFSAAITGFIRVGGLPLLPLSLAALLLPLLPIGMAKPQPS